MQTSTGIGTSLVTFGFVLEHHLQVASFQVGTETQGVGLLFGLSCRQKLQNVHCMPHQRVFVHWKWKMQWNYSRHIRSNCRWCWTRNNVLWRPFLTSFTVIYLSVCKEKNETNMCRLCVQVKMCLHTQLAGINKFCWLWFRPDSNEKQDRFLFSMFSSHVNRKNVLSKCPQEPLVWISFKSCRMKQGNGNFGFSYPW